jgi:hypothetical protein
MLAKSEGYEGIAHCEYLRGWDKCGGTPNNFRNFSTFIGNLLISDADVNLAQFRHPL